MADESVAFLKGNGFYLRELRVSDLDGDWYAWFNDAETTRWQNKKIFPNTRLKQRAYFDYLASSSSDVVLAMVEGGGNRHIGNVGLHKIDWVHRSAELGIVIGNREFWGRGFGKQAWQLITDYGFDTLNLHRVYAWIVANNFSSARCAEAAGFRKEGSVRDMFYKQGEYLDVDYFNIVRSDRP